MGPADSLICTGCGLPNRSHRLFCRGCGLGLEVAGGNARALDAPVGSIYFHGLVGGLLSLPVSWLLLVLLLRFLEASDDLVASARFLTLYLEWGGPTFFGLGASLLVVRRGRRLGLPASVPQALTGGLWTVGLGIVVASWAGPMALVLAGLCSPLGAARLGLGIFRPWWPLPRMVLVSALVVALSAVLALMEAPKRERVLMDQAGDSLAVTWSGTVLVLEGLQPAVGRIPLPKGCIGLAWNGSHGILAIGDGVLLGFDGRVVFSSGPSTRWRHAMRLSTLLLIGTSEGLLAFDWLDLRKPPELLWPASRGRVLAFGLGPGARTAYGRLDTGDLLEISANRSLALVKNASPPLAIAVTLDGTGQRVYAAIERQVLCRSVTAQTWSEASIGLRVRRIIGLCCLGSQIAVATERGLYVGQGTAAEPFRRIVAGRFQALQASETGALAVSEDSVYRLTSEAGWSRTKLPLKVDQSHHRIPRLKPGMTTRAERDSGDDTKW